MQLPHPLPDSPSSANQSAASPQPLDPATEASIVADMEALGIDPAMIYAFQHTGVLVTDATIDLLSDAQLLGWQQAVDRYRAIAA